MKTSLAQINPLYPPQVGNNSPTSFKGAYCIIAFCYLPRAPMSVEIEQVSYISAGEDGILELSLLLSPFIRQPVQHLEFGAFVIVLGSFRY